MKRRVWTSIFLALLVLPAPAIAQALWEGSRHGMGRAEVGRLFPAAQVPADADELAGGEEEGLRIERVELAGLPFRASFFFAGDGLVQVMLQLDDAVAAREKQQAFARVAEVLQSRHGAPGRRESSAQPFPRRGLEWQVQGARLKLFYAEFGGAPLLNIIWQVGPPQAPAGPRLTSPVAG